MQRHAAITEAVGPGAVEQIHRYLAMVDREIERAGQD
jgi:hypothetical protein